MIQYRPSGLPALYFVQLRQTVRRGKIVIGNRYKTGLLGKPVSPLCAEEHIALVLKHGPGGQNGISHMTDRCDSTCMQVASIHDAGIQLVCMRRCVDRTISSIEQGEVFQCRHRNGDRVQGAAPLAQHSLSRFQRRAHASMVGRFIRAATNRAGAAVHCQDIFHATS